MDLSKMKIIKRYGIYSYIIFTFPPLKREMNKINPFKSLLILSLIIISTGSCKDESIDTPETVVNKPSLTTDDVIAVKQLTASCGGNITSDGGAAITDRGVCWNLTGTPSITDSKISAGTGKGIFTVNLNGLSLGTKYYVRAYATNSKGTSYGEEKNFTTDATLEIGLAYAGGLIFYLDLTKQHGLVCADTTLGVFNKWGCKGKKLTGAMGKTIGTGAQNTIDISAGCPSVGAAGDICSKFVFRGYSDWFLPSQDELALIYTNLAKNGLGGFAKQPHWSSTQAPTDGANFAIGISFTDGSVSNAGKDNPSYIRAARAF